MSLLGALLTQDLGCGELGNSVSPCEVLSYIAGFVAVIAVVTGALQLESTRGVL